MRPKQDVKRLIKTIPTGSFQMYAYPRQWAFQCSSKSQMRNFVFFFMDVDWRKLEVAVQAKMEEQA